jgi:hypothetical protein
MNRSEARHAIKQALEQLGLFAAVLNGTPDSFGGKTPIAVVSSTGMQPTRITRGVLEVASSMTVSIYVERPANGAAATEDTLDTLTLATIQALLATDDFVPGQSDASAGGAPNRIIDSKIYRVERIPVTIAEDYGA